MDEHDLTKFQPFPKIQRLFREVIITEKLDGTNAQVAVSDDGETVRAGSRKRWITPESDNFGFARWVHDNAEELKRLGPGRHFGEWWGAGIQRGYGLSERCFSLFNVTRWAEDRPACCGVVPTLYKGVFSEEVLCHALNLLRREGSVAAPGFMKPEGIIVFHVRAAVPFKCTLEGDGEKGSA